MLFWQCSLSVHRWGFEMVKYPRNLLNVYMFILNLFFVWLFVCVWIVTGSNAVLPFVFMNLVASIWFFLAELRNIR